MSVCTCVCVCVRVWEIDLGADGSMCGQCGTAASLGGAGTLGLTGRLGFLSSSVDTCLHDFMESGSAAPSLKLHDILKKPQDEKCAEKRFIIIQM